MRNDVEEMRNDVGREGSGKRSQKVVEWVRGIEEVENV